VRPIAGQLKADGLRVWFAEEQIKPGDSIPAKLREGLRRSRVLVLCMSAKAFGSDWVFLEADTALFRDPGNKQRRFIPIRLDDHPVEDSLAQFSSVDWRPAVRGRAYPALLAACRGVGLEGGLDAPSRPDAGSAAVAPSRQRRWPLPLAVVALALALAIGAAVWSWGSRSSGVESQSGQHVTTVPAGSPRPSPVDPPAPPAPRPAPNTSPRTPAATYEVRFAHASGARIAIDGRPASDAEGYAEELRWTVARLSSGRHRIDVAVGGRTCGKTITVPLHLVVPLDCDLSQ
jgi:hypothetical protein